WPGVKGIGKFLTGKHEADEIQEGTRIWSEPFKIFPLPSSCISCPSCLPVKMVGPNAKCPSTVSLGHSFTGSPGISRRQMPGHNVSGLCREPHDGHESN